MNEVKQHKTRFVVGLVACPMSVESHATREDDISDGWVKAMPPFQLQTMCGGRISYSPT